MYSKVQFFKKNSLKTKKYENQNCLKILTKTKPNKAFVD